MPNAGVIFFFFFFVLLFLSTVLRNCAMHDPDECFLLYTSVPFRLPDVVRTLTTNTDGQSGRRTLERDSLCCSRPVYVPCQRTGSSSDCCCKHWWADQCRYLCVAYTPTWLAVASLVSVHTVILTVLTLLCSHAYRMVHVYTQIFCLSVYC